MGDITVTLKEDSWKNIFEGIRNSRINSTGNFWTAIQLAEEQVSGQIHENYVEEAFESMG